MIAEPGSPGQPAPPSTAPQGGQTGAPPAVSIAAPLAAAAADTARSTARAGEGGTSAIDGIASNNAPAAADPGAFLTRNSALAAQASAPRPAAAHVPLPADQVAVQIGKAADEGLDLIRLQLKPAELGRIEVQMEMAQDGRLQAIITADRSDTLQTLQRDARVLEQALQNAGFDLDADDLSFQHGSQQRDRGEDGSPPTPQSDWGEGDRADASLDPEAMPPADPNHMSTAWRSGELTGLDIRL